MELLLDRLTKQYGSKIAVDCVSATLKPGVYGLLGANGAGKTTLMRMLCAILESTSGEVLLNGKEITSLGAAYRNVLGYLPQDFGYYPNYTAMEFLMYVAALKGIPRDHHQPIVSEETFARAQEIRERRNGGRKSPTPGKREKYSRQYAFSCMLECGFCGSSLSRRRWHSNSKYKKTIWQCVTSTKSGKRYCPDSKGIPEQVIEEAFVESYKMLCSDNKDILEEFISRVEKTLSEDTARDKLMKYQKSADNLQSKRKTLLEKYLEGVVSQDIYEETDVGYERKLSNIRANIEMLEQQMEDEVSLKRRVEDFKKALSQNEVLQEFDRGIFESIIEKVIVGGYDEDGNKDPYKITFIYKTGFRNEVRNAKERFDKAKSVGDKAKELCSHIADEVKDVCSYVSDNTCRDGS